MEKKRNLKTCIYKIILIIWRAGDHNHHNKNLCGRRKGRIGLISWTRSKFNKRPLELKTSYSTENCSDLAFGRPQGPPRNPLPFSANLIRSSLENSFPICFESHELFSRGATYMHVLFRSSASRHGAFVHLVTILKNTGAIRACCAAVCRLVLRRCTSNCSK